MYYCIFQLKAVYVGHPHTTERYATKPPHNLWFIFKIIELQQTFIALVTFVPMSLLPLWHLLTSLFFLCPSCRRRRERMQNYVSCGMSSTNHIINNPDPLVYMEEDPTYSEARKRARSERFKVPLICLTNIDRRAYIYKFEIRVH